MKAVLMLVIVALAGCAARQEAEPRTVRVEVPVAVPSSDWMMQVSRSFAVGMRGSATLHRPLSCRALADTAPADWSNPTTP